MGQFLSDAYNRTSIAYGLKSWSTWGLYGAVIVFLMILWCVLPGADPAATGG